MSQRPSIKQPRPLTSNPVDPRRMAADAQSLATTQMLGELQSEVSPEAAPLWNFVLTHAHALALGILAIIALIVGVACWQWYAENSADSARADLGRISATLDPQARLAALEKFAASVPTSVAIASNLELAATAAQAQEWGKAAAAYAAVATAEGNSPLGFTARLNEVDILMRQGKAPEALTKLEALAGNAPEELRTMVQQQMAEAAEAAGQKDKAIAAYKAAIDTLPPTADVEAAYYKTRITRLQ